MHHKYGPGTPTDWLATASAGSRRPGFLTPERQRTPCISPSSPRPLDAVSSRSTIPRPPATTSASSAVEPTPARPSGSPTSRDRTRRPSTKSVPATPIATNRFTPSPALSSAAREHRLRRYPVADHHRRRGARHPRCDLRAEQGQRVASSSYPAHAAAQSPLRNPAPAGGTTSGAAGHRSPIHSIRAPPTSFYSLPETHEPPPGVAAARCSRRRDRRHHGRR